MSDGHVFCWGNAEKGRLGGGATDGVPFEVPGINDAIEVSAGGAHTCILHATGSLSCFGSNLEGELGVPLATTGPQTPTPSPVVGLGPVLHVSAGTGYTCVVQRDTNAYCFGRGEVSCAAGLNTKPAQPNPTPRMMGSNFVDVGAQYTHTCFVQGNGFLSCFGHNFWGEIGRTVDETYPCFSPAQNPAASGVSKLAIGFIQTCFLDGDKVYCMGQAREGSIGVPASDNPKVTSPRTVVGWESDVVSVASALDVTCAIRANSTVECIGRNRAVLGRNIGNPIVPTPAPIPNLRDVVAIDGQNITMCAIVRPSGQRSEVRCWGSRRRKPADDASQNANAPCVGADAGRWRAPLRDARRAARARRARSPRDHPFLRDARARSRCGAPPRRGARRSS